MKFFKILALLSLVTLGACSIAKKVEKLIVVETEKEYFSIYRGGCYGNCPSYKVEIQRDGNFSYYGSSNVKNIGDKKGKLSNEQVDNLFKLLAKYKWESYLEVYPVNNVDFPSFKIEYANGKTIKHIKANSNAPKELQELSLTVDALLKGLGY
ncbi:MAG: hypothetical protein ACI8ZX_000800 [Planctomycetota bacterium]|jgi:hypothetical protein